MNIIWMDVITAELYILYSISVQLVLIIEEIQQIPGVLMHIYRIQTYLH